MCLFQFKSKTYIQITESHFDITLNFVEGGTVSQPSFGLHKSRPHALADWAVRQVVFPEPNGFAHFFSPMNNALGVL